MHKKAIIYKKQVWPKLQLLVTINKKICFFHFFFEKRIFLISAVIITLLDVPGEGKGGEREPTSNENYTDFGFTDNAILGSRSERLNHNAEMTFFY